MQRGKNDSAFHNLLVICNIKFKKNSSRLLKRHGGTRRFKWVSSRVRSSLHVFWVVCCSTHVCTITSCFLQSHQRYPWPHPSSCAREVTLLLSDTLIVFFTYLFTYWVKQRKLCVTPIFRLVLFTTKPQLLNDHKENRKVTIERIRRLYEYYHCFIVCTLVRVSY